MTIRAMMNGKGGTGKSTQTALEAVQLARDQPQKDVLLCDFTGASDTTKKVLGSRGIEDVLALVRDNKAGVAAFLQSFRKSAGGVALRDVCVRARDYNPAAPANLWILPGFAPQRDAPTAYRNFLHAYPDLERLDEVVWIGKKVRAVFERQFHEVRIDTDADRPQYHKTPLLMLALLAADQVWVPTTCEPADFDRLVEFLEDLQTCIQDVLQLGSRPGEPPLHIAMLAGVVFNMAGLGAAPTKAAERLAARRGFRKTEATTYVAAKEADSISKMVDDLERRFQTHLSYLVLPTLSGAMRESLREYGIPVGETKQTRADKGVSQLHELLAGLQLTA